MIPDLTKVDHVPNSTIPYTIILPTAYGQMLLNRHDINQTENYVKTGLALDHQEIQLLINLLGLYQGDRVVLDVGANFGAYSLALSRHVGANGKVFAFEAQRILFNMICGSVALNAIENIYCHHLAVSNIASLIEIPQFDYGKPLNFGSVEFGPQQREPLAQSRGSDPARIEYVLAAPLDSMNFARVDMIKIDVEGMEFEVLQGAQTIIQRDKPILFIEYLKVDHTRLADYLVSLGYRVFAQNINYLCIPPHLQDRLTLNSEGSASFVTG